MTREERTAERNRNRPQPDPVNFRRKTYPSAVAGKVDAPTGRASGEMGPLAGVTRADDIVGNIPDWAKEATDAGNSLGFAADSGAMTPEERAYKRARMMWAQCQLERTRNGDGDDSPLSDLPAPSPSAPNSPGGGFDMEQEEALRALVGLATSRNTSSNFRNRSPDPQNTHTPEAARSAVVVSDSRNSCGATADVVAAQQNGTSVCRVGAHDRAGVGADAGVRGVGAAAVTPGGAHSHPFQRHRTQTSAMSSFDGSAIGGQPTSPRLGMSRKPAVSPMSPSSLRGKMMTPLEAMAHHSGETRGIPRLPGFSSSVRGDGGRYYDRRQQLNDGGGRGGGDGGSSATRSPYRSYGSGTGGGINGNGSPRGGVVGAWSDQPRARPSGLATPPPPPHLEVGGAEDFAKAAHNGQERSHNSSISNAASDLARLQDSDGSASSSTPALRDEGELLASLRAVTPPHRLPGAGVGSGASNDAGKSLHSQSSQHRSPSGGHRSITPNKSADGSTMIKKSRTTPMGASASPTTTARMEAATKDSTSRTSFEEHRVPSAGSVGSAALGRRGGASAAGAGPRATAGSGRLPWVPPRQAMIDAASGLASALRKSNRVSAAAASTGDNKANQNHRR